jgi:hypothetical protein
MELDRGGTHIETSAKRTQNRLTGDQHQIWQLEFDIKNRTARTAQQVVVPLEPRIVTGGRTGLLNLNQMPVLNQCLERPVNRAQRNVRHELTHRLEDAGGIRVLPRGLNSLEDGLALTGEADDGHKELPRLTPEEPQYSGKLRWNQ